MAEGKGGSESVMGAVAVATVARIEDGVVVLPDGERIRLPLKVVQLVQVEGVLVVRGEDGSRYVSANLWGLDLKGRVLWQVTEWPPLDSEFTELDLRDGKLSAFNFNGYRCELNASTGQVSNVVFTK